MSDEIQNNVIRHARSDLASMPDASHDAPKVEKAHSKLGEGHFMGMMRKGGHEITAALQALPDSNITPGEEANVFGNANAPQHVTKPQQPQPQEKSYAAMLDQAASRQSPSHDRDRGPSR